MWAIIKSLTHNCWLVGIDSHSILHAPCNKTYQPDNDMWKKIAKYLIYLFLDSTATEVQTGLLRNMPSWGKVCITNGGDMVRTVSASHNPDKNRDMFYVWVRYPVQIVMPRTYHFSVWSHSQRLKWWSLKRDILWSSWKNTGMSSTQQINLEEIPRQNTFVSHHHPMYYKWPQCIKDTYPLQETDNSNHNWYTCDQLGGWSSFIPKKMGDNRSEWWICSDWFHHKGW